jgi:hypothetical protein
MKHWLMGLCVLLLAGTCLAGERSARERVEASTLVDGTIGITPEGKVLAYTLDRPEQLQPVVKEIVAKSVPQWTFQPVLVDGKPVAAKTKMHLRLVAVPQGDGNYQVSIRSAYFGDQSSSVKHVQQAAPRYPEQAIRAHIGGTVYVMLRIDRDGKVTDAIATQVNLDAMASGRVLKQWRQVFAEASLRAARQWTFTPAGAGEPDYRVVATPVSYWLEEAGQRRSDTYGRWETYVPGPIEPAPWFDAHRMLSAGADALPGDGIYGQPSLSLISRLDRG